MKTLLATVLISWTLAAYAAQPRIATPGEVFGGEYIRIHPPASGTWVIISEYASGIVFAKGDRSASESFVAAVSVFGLPPTQTSEELEAWFREAAERGTDPSRFQVQQEAISYSNERPYPCVRYRSVAKDKAPLSASAPLLLEIDALYCRHPVHPSSGFSATYSHRGTQRHPGLRAEAEAFIRAVQAPGR